MIETVNDFLNEQYVKLIAFLTSDHEREEGQGLVEYALIISLISVALVVALGSLKTGIAGVFSDIVASF